MQITLTKASLVDAEIIHQMQLTAFKPLLEKYQDYDTNPGNEQLERTIERIKDPASDYYIIKADQVPVGAIRIVKKAKQCYRISPIFILPEHQGKGIAQRVLSMIEELYSDFQAWELDTMLQEPKNCHLYEKQGYQRTGFYEQINERLTIVSYEKRR